MHGPEVHCIKDSVPTVHSSLVFAAYRTLLSAVYRSKDATREIIVPILVANYMFIFSCFIRSSDLHLRKRSQDVAYGVAQHP